MPTARGLRAVHIRQITSAHVTIIMYHFLHCKRNLHGLTLYRDYVYVALPHIIGP